MNTCISKTWRGEKEIERQKSTSFPFHSLNPTASATLVSWPQRGSWTALLVCGTFDLPSSYTHPMRNWVGATMSLWRHAILWGPDPQGPTLLRPPTLLPLFLYHSVQQKHSLSGCRATTSSHTAEEET